MAKVNVDQAVLMVTTMVLKHKCIHKEKKKQLTIWKLRMMKIMILKMTNNYKINKDPVVSITMVATVMCKIYKVMMIMIWN